MKPIRLEIEGVNSYAKAQVIDFNELTSRGLFGIFGNTGSGKSTILDAIILSLYGRIPRSSKDFVNSNCKKALVDFEFELGLGESRKYYKVTRKFNRRGDGNKVTTLSDSVRLMVKNSMGEYTVLADKVGDVNSNIKNILGLEEGDFLKSVVLPQGKFSEFLSLGGKDRRNMLERIFDLEEYGSSLMFKVGRYRKGIESQVTSIRAIMSQHENISTAYLKELELNLKNTLVRKDETENGVKDLSKSLEEMKSLDSLLKDLFDAKHQERSEERREKYINELTKKLDLSMSMTSILGELTEFVSTKSYISDTRIKIGKNKDIIDRKSTRLNSSHANISYAVFC